MRSDKRLISEESVNKFSCEWGGIDSEWLFLRGKHKNGILSCLDNFFKGCGVNGFSHGRSLISTRPSG